MTNILLAIIAAGVWTGVWQAWKLPIKRHKVN